MKLTLFVKNLCLGPCTDERGYLLKNKYLSEFRSDEEKALARENLGISKNEGSSNYIIVETNQDLKLLSTDKYDEGTLVRVNKDIDEKYFYVLKNGKWEVSESNTLSTVLGIPIYSQEIINNQEGNLPDEYIKIDTESDLEGEITEKQYTTSTNGSYLDILFSAIRSLQSEVTKLRNSFKYGINSYTDGNTALSSSIDEDSDNEPLWAIDEDDLSAILIIPMKAGNNILPSENVDITVSGLLTINNTGTYTCDLSNVEDVKLFLYITSTKKTIKVNLKDKTGEDLVIDLSKLNHNTCSLYNYMILVSRKQDDKGANYIYVQITNGYTDSVISAGYWNNNTLNDNIYEVSSSYYINTVEFTDLTLTKFNIYSKYLDFSNSVFPSLPDDKEYKYEAAHITIRSVKSKEVMNKISSQLLNKELIWDEGEEKLYIKSNNKIVAIGTASTDNNTSNSNSGMDESEVLELLKEIGLVVDEDSNGNFTDIHLNNIADLTFIHQDTGNKYKISVDSEGNLVSSKITDIEKLEDNAYIQQALNTTGNIRGLIGTSGAYIYKGTDGTNVNSITNNIGLNSDRLKIGAVYALQEGDEVFGCSHAYVELENTSDRDFNLDGCYLHFAKMNTSTKKVEVKHLALTGVIYSGSTYLIRGKQYVEYDSPNCFVKVSSYDLEWYDNGELIDFSFNATNGIGFCLTLGLETLEYNTSLLSINGDTYSNYDPHFIDAMCIGSNKLDGTNNYWTPSAFTATSNCIFKNTFELDPANQAYQALYSKDSSRVRWNKPATDYQYLTLNKEYIEFPHTDERFPISNYTPKASYENKNVCTDKSKLNLYKPNMVTCSFGIDIHKTRCFNWISAGVFDEFVFIKDGSDWKKFESYKTIKTKIAESTTYPHRKEFSETINNVIYARIISTFPADNTRFTAHKCIIDITDSSVSSPKTYTYVVGREDKNGNPDFEHCSEECTFTIYPESYTPVVYQITDLQGFHWVEYQAWAAAANKINEEISARSGIIPILINTGDMTQNGTRINEWLDYYNAGKVLFDHLELMNVVGNNDLCGTSPSELGTGDDAGKSNSYYFHLFYCYEIDELIPPIYTGTDGITRYIPSLYYFGNSKLNFLMVNSEITKINCRDWFKATSGNDIINIYTGFTIGTDNDKKYIDSDNLYIYELLYWIFNKINNVTAVCHEMPFTVITKANLASTTDIMSAYRSEDKSSNAMGLVGSHLNQITADETGKGTYWFSRLLEDKGVKLCIGGHKHTYACTYPLRENYKGMQTNSPMYMDSSLKNDTIEFIVDGLNLTKLPYANITDVGDPESGYFYPVTPTTDTLNNAVVYFMCQATGYKLNSNKELPAATLRFSKFVPLTNGSSPSQEQLYPMFGIIEYGDSTGIKLVRIKGIKTSKNKFDLNTFDSSDMSLEYLNEGTEYYGDWSTANKTLITL